MTEMERKHQENTLGERESLNGLNRSLVWSDWWMVDQTNVEFIELCILEIYQREPYSLFHRFQEAN